MKFRKVSHVIFDMDGLLLDTETLYTTATQHILSKYGKEYTWEHKMHIMGCSFQDSASYLIKTFDLPMTIEEYGRLNEEQYEILFAHPKLMPDTETIYDMILSNLAKKNGAPQIPVEIKLKSRGCNDEVRVQKVFRSLELKCTETEFLEQYQGLYEKELSKAKMMPGAEKLIRHLYDNKIPIAVATSSSREGVALKTKDHQNLFVLFNHLVSGSSDIEVKHSKPAPDIFLVCASKFPKCPNPQDVLVFEDAPNGVLAANSAGMQVVMVPDPRIPDEKKEKATLVLHTLEEFKPEDFGLPPFPKN